jgi:hypothetical protein
MNSKNIFIRTKNQAEAPFGWRRQKRIDAQHKRKLTARERLHFFVLGTKEVLKKLVCWKSAS